MTIGDGAWLGAGAKILDGVTHRRARDHRRRGGGARGRGGRRRGGRRARPHRLVASANAPRPLTVAVLAVVTSSPPGVEGGHLVIARAIVAAAQAAGHEPNLVITPDFGFGRSPSTYARELAHGCIEWQIGRPVDQVISLRYPSYAVRHPSHICWLNHTMREYYDLWPRFSGSISAASAAEGERHEGA